MLKRLLVLVLLRPLASLNNQRVNRMMNVSTDVLLIFRFTSELSTVLYGTVEKLPFAFKGTVL
jgi:hypothetical protein